LVCQIAKKWNFSKKNNLCWRSSHSATDSSRYLTDSDCQSAAGTSVYVHSRRQVAYFKWQLLSFTWLTINLYICRLCKSHGIHLHSHSKRHLAILATARIGNTHFVSHNVLSEDVCPEKFAQRPLPRTTFANKTFAQDTFAKKDICLDGHFPIGHLPRRHLLKNKYDQKDICIERQLSIMTLPIKCMSLGNGMYTLSKIGNNSKYWQNTVLLIT
jgi:hypothetical protein